VSKRSEQARLILERLERGEATRIELAEMTRAASLTRRISDLRQQGHDVRLIYGPDGVGKTIYALFRNFRVPEGECPSFGTSGHQDLPGPPSLLRGAIGGQAFPVHGPPEPIAVDANLGEPGADPCDGCSLRGWPGFPECLEPAGGQYSTPPGCRRWPLLGRPGGPSCGHRGATGVLCERLATRTRCGPGGWYPVCDDHAGKVGDGQGSLFSR